MKRALTYLGLLGMAACATGPATRGSEAPANAGCQVAELFEHPIPLSAFADSAGVAEAIVGRLSQDAGPTFANLVLDSIEGVYEVSILSDGVSDTTRKELVRLVTEHLVHPPLAEDLPQHLLIDLQGEPGWAPRLLQQVEQCAPDILNRAGLARALREEYPPDLRRRGIGGVVRLHIHIDGSGSVIETKVARSSGQTAMDMAAHRVASRMEFSPAMLAGIGVEIWIQFDITFSSRSEPPEPGGH